MARSRCIVCSRLNIALEARPFRLPSTGSSIISVLHKNALRVVFFEREYRSVPDSLLLLSDPTVGRFRPTVGVGQALLLLPRPGISLLPAMHSYTPTKRQRGWEYQGYLQFFYWPSQGTCCTYARERRLFKNHRLSQNRCCAGSRRVLILLLPV